MELNQSCSENVLFLFVVLASNYARICDDSRLLISSKEIALLANWDEWWTMNANSMNMPICVLFRNLIQSANCKFRIVSNYESHNLAQAQKPWHTKKFKQ